MRRHQFKGSEFDVLPLGGPVDPAAVTADDTLIDTLADDALIELLADDALIEALVARMPPGTAPPRGEPPRGDVLAGLLAQLLTAWVAEARGYGPPRWNVAATGPSDLERR
jgi:hypothetical protein